MSLWILHLQFTQLAMGKVDRKTFYSFNFGALEYELWIQRPEFLW